MSFKPCRYLKEPDRWCERIFLIGWFRCSLDRKAFQRLQSTPKSKSSSRKSLWSNNWPECDSAGCSVAAFDLITAAASIAATSRSFRKSADHPPVHQVLHARPQVPINPHWRKAPGSSRTALITRDAKFLTRKCSVP